MNDEIFKNILIEAIGDRGTVEVSTKFLKARASKLLPAQAFASNEDLDNYKEHRFCVNNIDGIPISILEYEIKNNTIVIIDKMFTEAKSFDLHDPKVFAEIKEFIFPIINQKEYLNKIKESNLE